LDEIEFGEDYVSISDEQGEVVRWVMQEWVEDPTVVLSIANAVRIAASGQSVRKFLETKSGNRSRRKGGWNTCL